jgi:hypothetical protein
MLTPTVIVGLNMKFVGEPDGLRGDIGLCGPVGLMSM